MPFTASKSAARSRRPVRRIATLLAALLLAATLALPGGASGSPTSAGAPGQSRYGSRPPLAAPSRIQPSPAVPDPAPDSPLAGAPFLFKDINTIATPPNTNPPDLLHAVAIGSMLYMVAGDDIHGPQIWKTDTTLTGTVMVSDISVAPIELVNFDGTLFFIASTDDGQLSLWRSDGTPAGTTRVKVLGGHLPYGFDSTSLTVVNGALFFIIGDDLHGNELWTSDGTAAGTHLLKEIRYGSDPAFNYQFGNFLPISLGSAFLFVANDGIHGDELWRSDGTTQGTWLVKDIRPGEQGSFLVPWMMRKLNNRVLFVADDGVHGYGLWTSDGTAAGTQFLKPIHPFNNFYYENLPMLNGALFFGASDGAHGYELWRSDGTAQGTWLVKDINPGANSSGDLTSDLTPISVNGQLLFIANDGVHGSELWRSDGTAAGTVLVKDIVGGPGGSHLEELTNVNGRLFFTQAGNLWTSDGTAAGTVGLKTNIGMFGSLSNLNGTLFAFKYGSQAGLWHSDGTPAGTVLIKGFTPWWSWRGPIPVVDNTLLFVADDGVHGFELWRSDGTPAGSALVKNVTPEVSNGIPPDRSLMATNVNGSLFFVANDSVHGNELWASDGAAQSTHMVKDIFSTNFPDDIPESLTSMKGALYFLVGSGIWKSNGTEAGTVIVKEPALIQHYFTGLTNVNGMLFFASDDKLWRSDGTTAGTTPLRTFIHHICYRCDYEPAIDTFWNVNGRLFFSADDGQGYRLWTSDGTPEGTVAASGIVPDGELPWLEVANGTWFFPAADGAHGAELWTSAGTPGSARLVKDIAPGRADANVSPLASVGRTLYLIADDGVHGAELWKSDGTAAGTTLVKDITPGADGSQIAEATAAGNLLFFVTQDASHGRELWKSDGTAAGTQLVRDINSGLDNAFGSKPILTPLDDLVIFAADDGVHGTELWTSDGSAAGTTMAADIAPGSGSSHPGGFTSAGRYLFFSANDGTHGKELWALPLRSYPFRRITVGLGALIQAEDFDQGSERLAYHDRDPFNRGAAYRPDDAVDLQADTGSSGGVHLAWTQPGEWLNYTVQVASTQTYTLTVRVASQGQGGVFHIAVDGVDWTGPLGIPDTGGWYSWRTLEKSGLRLAAGRHTLRLVLDADGATSGVGNIDWFSLLAPAKYRVFLPEVH